ncbi:MAG: OmpA family protein [Treponema sp.]|nr:OmpA family protein [Treponema sp.]
MNKTQKIFTSFTAFFLLAASGFADNGIQFEFKHKKGDAYSYISTVEEDVFYNGYLNHHAQIINRISSTVENAAPDGQGFIYANYMTTEDSVSNRSGRHLVWGEDTTSVFARKKTGELTISDDIFMPTVRNVPVFPGKKIKKGESWTAIGKEVQDMRKPFNMNKALVFPFEANYTYTKDETVNGKTFNVIEVNYDFQYQNTEANLEAGELLYASVGYSKQTLYWDSKKGLLDHYNEEFQIKIQDINGNIFVFQGIAHAEITEYKSLNDETNVQLLQETLDDMKLNDITVKRGDKGLTISIENIQFEPDSNILLDSEKVKIQKLSKILNQYTNDLLITGHCAERGTAKARQKLSEERAEAVASYLEQLGVRDEYHLFTRGKGSTEPIATNSTEEGRKKNRRVEITIMD